MIVNLFRCLKQPLNGLPVGKIAEKAICGVYFFLSVKLTKNALLQTVFFTDFAHWVSTDGTYIIFMVGF